MREFIKQIESSNFIEIENVKGVKYKVYLINKTLWDKINTYKSIYIKQTRVNKKVIYHITIVKSDIAHHFWIRVIKK